jgi:hypothetical protein
LVACGGESRGRGGGSSDAAGSSGTASSSAGAVGVGGSAAGGGVSGGAGAEPATRCDEEEAPLPRPACTPNCSADPNDALSLECVAGTWQCPPGFRLSSSCPAGSCARSYDQACCDTTTGHGASTECDSDGMAQCAPGAAVIEYGELCRPDAIVTESCGSLQGTPCSSSEYECHQGRACGATNCTCAANGAGSLAWQCATNPC